MNHSTPKPTNPDDLAVTLTVGQIEAIVRSVVESVVIQDNHGDSLLTADELAAKLKVPVSWVYEQSRQGNIPTVRIGRYIRFNLQKVIESQRKTSA